MLSLFNENEKQLFTSRWYLEFGKTISEVYNDKEDLCYIITKKFKFWKWKMTYTIEKNDTKIGVLSSQNLQYTVFETTINSDTFRVEQHYQQKKSIFKNSIKIAEIDESKKEENAEKIIKIQVLDSKDIDKVFLLFCALMTGVNNQKSILKSQKTLIPNEDDWSKLA